MGPLEALRKHPDPIALVTGPQKGPAAVIRVLELDERMGQRAIERVSYPNQVAPPEVLIVAPSSQFVP